ncbi:hypothetical protein [Thioalkalivibrio sp. ALE19]|uniref:hypothetical protein n=1 Tax=Thioalkalivibrio sp. ALE19 TaxID=1266909 RepID=UPI0012DC9661|nr:hypothetical protein [Thioalkalivibrio sp. ALE19]
MLNSTGGGNIARKMGGALEAWRPVRFRAIRESRKALARVREESDPEEVIRRIHEVPDSIFPDFVIEVLLGYGFSVHRLPRFDAIRKPHAEVEMMGSRFLIQIEENVPDRMRGRHQAVTINALAENCEQSGKRGIYVAQDPTLCPNLIRQAGEDKDGSSIAGIHKPEVADLILGRCVNDPATGRALIDRKGGGR